MEKKIEEVKLNWVMDGYTSFHAIYGGLRIEIHSGRWYILRGSDVIDYYACHRSPATCSELSAKVDAAKYLNEYLTNQIKQ